MGEEAENVCTPTAVENPAEIPDSYALGQNYPNPFNPTTKIEYFVPRNSHVSLKVYDVIGNEVATLFEGMRNAGNYVVSFDGGLLSSGIYFYQMKSENFMKTKKLVLLK
ncbi:MAG: T9SS type A sorting domain-containing protein [Ignavibacteria bacterium]